MNAFKITRLCIFCIALMGVFCSAYGAKSSSALAAPQKNVTCNDPSNPRKSGDGKSGFYCIGQDLVGPQSYCLRESQHDPMHVRKMMKPEALLTMTPEGTVGSAKIIHLNAPSEGSCKSQSFTFANVGIKENDWFVIVKKKNSKDKELTLRLFNSSLYPRDIVDTDAWETTPSLFDLDLKAGGNEGEFYWYGERDGVTYFVMLADDRKGQMNLADTPNVPRIERYYYVEAFTKDSTCAGDRPDHGVQFRQWPTKPNDDTCDVIGGKTENGTGSGGHDYP